MRDAATILTTLKGQSALTARLAARWPVVGPLARATADALSPGMADGIRVLVTSGSVGASAEFIAALPDLALIVCQGSGYENIDLAAAAARGILVTYSPGANAASVADLAMGLMIASVRRIAEGDRFVRAGLWPMQRKPGGTRGLTGRRLGIFGLGAIGAKIAIRAAACEMTIAYHNRTPRADVPWRYCSSLAALAASCDVLIVSCRAGEETRGLVDASILRALGPQGHVVNIARGSVIDEPALIAALRDGAIAGAGLDVFIGEPHVSPALSALPNVVLTPHLGGGAQEAQSATAAMVEENIAAFLAGMRPPYCVPAPQGTDA